MKKMTLKKLLTLVTVLALLLSAMSFYAYATEPETGEPIIEEPIAGDGNGGTHMTVSRNGAVVSWSPKYSTITGFTANITVGSDTISVGTMTGTSGSLTLPSNLSGAALCYQGSVNYGTATMIIEKTTL